MLHGRPWILDPITLKATIEGAARLAPPSSKRPQRNPFTPDIIALFKSQLNLEDPLDVAVFACITVCFWGVARVSEFTVPSINAFDPTKHITRAGLTQITDRNGLSVLKFHLPWTKTSKAASKGESVQCAQQNGPADPLTAIENHFRINAVACQVWVYSGRGSGQVRTKADEGREQRAGQEVSPAGVGDRLDSTTKDNER